MFDTKFAVIVRDDMAVWRKLNVAAFLATGIGAGSPEAVGQPYMDAAGRSHSPLFGQPVLIFAADRAQLRGAHATAMDRGLRVAAYVGAMFGTGYDAANRAVFAAEPADDLDLVGLALFGPKRAVDKAVKGLALHA